MKKLLLVALLLLPVVSNAANPPDCRQMKRDETALACTIYYEARGATYADKLAVSFITINRSFKQNKSLVKIVKQPGQFSFMKRKGLIPKEELAWNSSKLIAKQMIKLSQDRHLYNTLDITQGATYYHDRSISNPWNFTLTLRTPNLLAYKE